MCSLDLERFHLSQAKINKSPQKQQPPRHKRGEKFLKGPIPYRWLSKAAEQGGKTLHVAIALWFLAGLKRTWTISLSRRTLEDFGVNRHSSYRGLKKLENIGLVSVVRRPGCLPKVTILDSENGNLA